MSSHQSQPLTDQPPTPHLIAHHGKANTALINRLTSPDLPLTHIHKTTIAPVYMRHQIQHLYHKHTICLRTPSLNCDLRKLYLNAEILNHTRKILNQESPHRATRHILPTFFMNRITQVDTTLHRLHRRQLETPGGPHLTHNYLILPFNITPVHWILLVHRTDHVHGTTTVSHDSIPMPKDITATEQHLRHYDSVLNLSPGFTSSPIHHVSAVKQEDAYNCGVCVLTTVIVYLYHPDPCNFPWQSRNYPFAVLHMRKIIIAIIQTGQAPNLTHDTIIPLTSLPPVPTSRIPCYPPTPTIERTTVASATHRNILFKNNPATHPRQPPSTDNPSHHQASVPNHQLRHIVLTKIATWNLNRQAAYDGPISVCLHGHIGILHCTEPAVYMSIPGSPSSFSLTRTTDKAGYSVYIIPHNHTYVRQNTS